MNRKLRVAREETEQIRRNCQQMIRTYQESEEVKSNNLDHQLKLKENELLQQHAERTDLREVLICLSVQPPCYFCLLLFQISLGLLL